MILLTGGSGFVGINMIPELIAAGYEVMALTRSSNSAEKVSKAGAAPVTDDINDEKARRDLGYKNAITFEEGIAALRDNK